MTTKAQLRELCLARRAGLAPADRCRISAVIARHVSAMPAFLDSRTVMLYLALPQEVQTDDLLVECRRKAKRVAVPVTTRHGLLAAQFRPGQDRLEQGALRRPRARRRNDDHSSRRYRLCPGAWNWLRRPRRAPGIWQGGTMTAFFAGLPASAQVCGLAFALQIVERVPDMPHDVRMQWLVTERGVRCCQGDP